MLETHSTEGASGPLATWSPYRATSSASVGQVATRLGRSWPSPNAYEPPVPRLSCLPFRRSSRATGGGTVEWRQYWDSRPPRPQPSRRQISDHVYTVAAASAERVSRILQPFPGALEHLIAHLAAEHKGATDAPATIEGFLDVLLPEPRTSRGDAPKRHVRALFGLDRLEGVIRPDVAAVATKLGVSRQALYVSLGRLRDQWKETQAAHVHAAAAGVMAVLRSVGGASSLDALASALPATLPHEAGKADGGEALVRAKALLRILMEVGPSLEPTPLRLLQGRVGGVPWVGETQAHLDAARALGEEASRLAKAEPLPSSEEARKALSKAANSTPLAELPADRMLSLAADASTDAALSARLELYPRAMPPERALRLTAGALPAEISPEDAQKTVSARYREATPLPERTPLDALMEDIGYAYDEEKARYVRRGLAPSVNATLAISARRATTHSHRVQVDESIVDAELFDQGIRDAVDRRGFRVLDVDQPWAEPAAKELSHRLQVPVRSLDRDLLAVAEAVMREKRISKAAVFVADRAGPTGPHWRKVLELMNEAAGRLATTLLGEDRPLILAHPGILARYGLEGFLSTLISASDGDRAPPIFLVNPVWQQQGGPPPIDDVDRTLPIPTGRASRRVIVPASWIQNKDRGGVA